MGLFGQKPRLRLVPGTTGSYAAFSTPNYPYLGFINYYSNIYRSNYNGLQLAFTSRNYHGFDFVAGYTYSHAIDNQSYNWNQYLPKDSNNPQGEYGNSDFDIRHRFTLSATYTIPGKKGYAQMLEGWQLNGILTLQSSQPWQAFDTSNDFSGTGELADRWNLFGVGYSFKSGGQDSIPLCTSSVNDPTSGSCGYVLSGRSCSVHSCSNQCCLGLVLAPLRGRYTTGMP